LGHSPPRHLISLNDLMFAAMMVVSIPLTWNKADIYSLIYFMAWRTPRNIRPVENETWYYLNISLNICLEFYFICYSLCDILEHICRILTRTDNCWWPLKSYLFVAPILWQETQALEYHINWEIHTPYAVLLGCCQES
jgi:hypothetical protein